MSRVLLHKSFIGDINGSTDAKLVRKAFMSVIGELLGNSNRSNDHRYHGIADGWIRYLSGGKTAYRLIYIRSGADIIFYRCGGHSVEDNLIAPTLSEDNLEELTLGDVEVEEMTLPKTFLGNHAQKLTLTALIGRRLIPNREVWIVSPFLSEELIRRGATLGRVLDSIVSEGTSVTIITALNQLYANKPIFDDLAARGIDVVFVEGLHSKIYLFVTDETIPHRTARVPSLGIIGSSNMTNSGISAQRGRGNRETNYTVPPESIPELMDIVHNYYYEGLDFQRAAKKLKSARSISK